MRHKLIWFINRIGKRVIRSGGGMCNCDTCRDAKTIGFIISDKHNHAQYLFDCQNELGAIYRDMPPKGAFREKRSTGKAVLENSRTPKSKVNRKNDKS